MRPNLHRLHVESRSSSSNSSRSKGPIAPQFPPLDILLLLAHCLGLACFLFTLVWVLRFRGGLPLIAHDQNLADYNDLIFNIHPVLMVAGFVVLASEAVLVFKSVPGTKSYKKAVHLTIQGVAVVMAILGIWAAFKFHVAKGIANFYSLHSWLGLGTVIMFACQWVVGYVVFWYPGASGKTRTALLPWHVLLGLFIYCMALVTVETGLLEKMTFLMGSNKVGRNSLESMFVNSVGLLVIVYGALVILAAVLPKVRREGAVRSVD